MRPGFPPGIATKLRDRAIRLFPASEGATNPSGRDAVELHALARRQRLPPGRRRAEPRQPHKRPDQRHLRRHVQPLLRVKPSQRLFQRLGFGDLVRRRQKRRVRRAAATKRRVRPAEVRLADGLVAGERKETVLREIGALRRRLAMPPEDRVRLPLLGGDQEAGPPQRLARARLPLRRESGAARNSPASVGASQARIIGERTRRRRAVASAERRMPAVPPPGVAPARLAVLAALRATSRNRGRSAIS